MLLFIFHLIFYQNILFRSEVTEKEMPQIITVVIRFLEEINVDELVEFYFLSLSLNFTYY